MRKVQAQLDGLVVYSLSSELDMLHIYMNTSRRVGAGRTRGGHGLSATVNASSNALSHPNRTSRQFIVMFVWNHNSNHCGKHVSRTGWPPERV